MFRSVGASALAPTLAMSLMLSACLSVPAPEAVGLQERVPASGPIAAAFDMQRCVNMGNSLERPKGANSWGAPIDITKFADIKAAGFDTVRIPVRWSAYTGPAPGYEIDPAFMAEVTAAVDTALSNDLNVILNVHHFEKIMANPKGEMDRLQAIWRQVATAFADRSDDLWFETLNEPNDELSGELMRATQEISYRAIRESNPDRIVIFGGEEWSGIESLPTNIAPPDANIVYTVHYYDPFDFTHQFASWVPAELVNKKRGWGSPEDRADLAKAVKTIEDFRRAVKHPVFVGEFGVYEPVDHDERVRWVGAVAEALEGGQTPWCLWSFSNTFALYDEETGWDADMVEALGVEVPADVTKPAPSIERFKTAVLSRKDAAREDNDWGTFLKYFEGASWGTENVLSGVAEIKPGWEIHPPHAHSEEEYLMVLEGSGTWTVNGEVFEAKAGDMLYAAPWDFHNVTNTGDTVLKFVFWKWNSSGLTPPEDPAK